MEKRNTSMMGVMFNAYPDSIGDKLEHAIDLLESKAFEGVFSYFYILPTFFNSDLDRGFSIIDYGQNKELTGESDLRRLNKLGIELKFDIVLNHLSVASPQFRDLLEKGDASEYVDFFINWNAFWEGKGTMNEDGIVVPDQQYLDKLFMRKSGLPILKVPFPDGTERPYWNTFYQKILFEEVSAEEISQSTHLNIGQGQELAEIVNNTLKKDTNTAHLIKLLPEEVREEVNILVKSKRKFLGQMDVNGHSPKVWEYYDQVLNTLAGYGCKIVRLDAFAYLHKEVGQTNFFNKPGTWEYLARINESAKRSGLVLLPEIHAEYGLHLHDEVAGQGYMIYDFFMPGLILHTIESQDHLPLYRWGNEIVEKGFKTVNMLGCHDGIPLLDLKGKEVDGQYSKGLLTDDEIESLMVLVIERGGKVKNLYGADGKKLSYYQVNATYFSALGEDEGKMLLARAIQMFMPGIPQVWYLDIFGGKNDYEAVEKAGNDGHKEINRTNLKMEDVWASMEKSIVKSQLRLLRLKNTHAAFSGTVSFDECNKEFIKIGWTNGAHSAIFEADLAQLSFSVHYTNEEGVMSKMNFDK